jgi:hypothetical protein
VLTEEEFLAKKAEILKRAGCISRNFQALMHRSITVSDGHCKRGRGGQMTAYQTVVVGTDGSESSLRAVDRAGEIASESNAKLIIATGYSPHEDDLRAADILGEEAYKVRGNAPIYAILREARDRAKAGRGEEHRGPADSGCSGTCTGGPCREGWGRSASGRQCGTACSIRDHRAGVLDSRSSRQQGQDRCTDRSHHRLTRRLPVALRR